MMSILISQASRGRRGQLLCTGGVCPAHPTYASVSLDGGPDLGGVCRHRCQAVQPQSAMCLQEGECHRALLVAAALAACFGVQTPDGENVDCARADNSRMPFKPPLRQRQLVHENTWWA